MGYFPRVRGVACLLLLPALVCAGGWPFGAARQRFRKLDLYNLGLLGAKAADAATPKPDLNAPPRTGRRQVQMQPASNDDGPDRLRIDVLFPEGPAERAGVKEGDILVGVGSRRFSKGSLEPIAKALLKAESGKGVVTLLVERPGEKGTRKIKVTIPRGGKAAAKPTVGPGRAALVERALAWLAKRQGQAGEFSATLSGLNGAVVQTSVAGLAWIGAGSDLKGGPHQDNLRRAADWLVGNIEGFRNETAARAAGGPSWNQSNWGLAHAAIFLGELRARTPERGIEKALHFAAGQLVENQERSGGWAHGPGGKNALGYLELNIVTGLALCGLGLARQSGFLVPDDCFDRAHEYLKKSSSGGGVGYSAGAGQAGQGNIGRTAATWLGYLALGRRKDAFCRQMGKYVAGNADRPLGGHASLMQHILLAGVAAHAQGGAAKKSFWKAMRRDLVLARAPDGSFQPRPWHESLSMKSNSDVTFGEVWTTGAWAMVLVSEESKDGKRGFPAWYGRK